MVEVGPTKNYVVFLIAMLLIIPAFSMNVSSWQSNEKKNLLTVDDDGGADFLTIQEALNASTDGDTIFVYNGLYEEHLVIENNINLIGEDKENTIIQGFNESFYYIILVKAQTISIEHITIRFSEDTRFYGHGINSYNEKYNSLINDIIISDCFIGIFAIGSDTLISNNTFIDCEYGIYLASNLKVIDNLFINSDLSIYAEKPKIINNKFYNSGININRYDDIDIFFYNNQINDKPFKFLYKESDKTITDQAGQIIILNCENINIKNQDMKTSHSSINLIKSNDCIISECEFNISKRAVSIFNCQDIFINNNEFDIFHNDFSSAQAISVIDSNSIEIMDNSIICTNNDFSQGSGIFSENSTLVVIMHNIFSNLNEGVLLISKNNVIKQNTFQDNEIGILYLRLSLKIFGFFGPFGEHLIQENNFIKNGQYILFYIMKWMVDGETTKELSIQKNHPIQDLVDNSLNTKLKYLHKMPNDIEKLKRTVIKKNYYDDHDSILPKIIRGYLFLITGNPDLEEIDWVTFDWRPQKNPIEW